MKRVIILQLLIFLSVFPIVTPSSDEPAKWEIVTKQNFSSLIRIHPHALLVVTLPCKPSDYCLSNMIYLELAARRNHHSSSVYRFNEQFFRVFLVLFHPNRILKLQDFDLLVVVKFP